MTSSLITMTSMALDLVLVLALALAQSLLRTGDGESKPFPRSFASLHTEEDIVKCAFAENALLGSNVAVMRPGNKKNRVESRRSATHRLRRHISPV